MRSYYKQQYVFGQVPFELDDLDTTTPSKSYLGSNLGGQAALDDGTHGDVAGYTMPIDLKAEKQAHVQKIRVEIRVLEALAGSGASAKIRFEHCPSSSGVPAVASVKDLIVIPIATADAIVPSAQPWMEFTMPSNCAENVAVSIVLDDKTKPFSAGKILIQMNPNI